MAMRHHYIPKFYLKGFTDPDVPPRYEPFLHVYELAAGVWSRRAPVKLANEPDYYAIETAGGAKHQDIEKALSGLEGRVAELMRGPIARREPLSLQQRVQLAEFVGAMLVRVPGNQQAAAARIAEEGQQALADLYAAVQADPALWGGGGSGRAGPPQRPATPRPATPASRTIEPGRARLN